MPRKFRKGDLVRLTDDGFELQRRGYDRGMGRHLGEIGRVTEVLTLGTDRDKRHVVMVDRFGNHWYDEDVLTTAEGDVLGGDDSGAENVAGAEAQAEASALSGDGDTSDAEARALLKVLQMLVESGDNGGDEDPKDESPEQVDDPQRHELLKGDFVKLDVDEDTLAELAEEHGGYVDDMAQYCGSTGYVSSVKRDRHMVQVTSMGTWWYNMDAFVVVRPVSELIFEGNLVRLTSDFDKLRSEEGYSPIMDEFMGKIGIATKVDMTKMMSKVQGFNHLWYSLDVLERFRVPPSLKCVKPTHFVGDHVLKPFKTTHSSFRCNECGTTQPSQTWMLSCREDDYYLCMSCAEPRLHAALEAQPAGQPGSVRRSISTAVRQGLRRERTSNPRALRTSQPRALRVSRRTSRRTSRRSTESVLICVISRHDDVSTQTVALLEGNVSEVSEGRAYMLGLQAPDEGDGTLRARFERHVERIRHANCMVVIVTPEYFHNVLCLAELGTAHLLGIPVYPIAVCTSEDLENRSLMLPVLRVFQQMRGTITRTSPIFGDSVDWASFERGSIPQIFCSLDDVLAGVSDLQRAIRGSPFLFGPLNDARGMKESAQELLNQLRPAASNPRETFHRFWLPFLRITIGVGGGLGGGLPLGDDFDNHIFLSHAWGPNQETHTRVKNLKEALVKRGIKVWMDEGQLGVGDLTSQLMQALRTAQFIGVCVTDEYLDKCERDAVTGNYVAVEYRWATVHRTHQIIPIIMEEKYTGGDAWGDGHPSIFLRPLFNVRFCHADDRVDKVAESVENFIVDKSIQARAV